MAGSQWAPGPPVERGREGGREGGRESHEVGVRERERRREGWRVRGHEG